MKDLGRVRIEGMEHSQGIAAGAELEGGELVVTLKRDAGKLSALTMEWRLVFDVEQSEAIRATIAEKSRAIRAAESDEKPHQAQENPATANVSGLGRGNG